MALTVKKMMVFSGKNGKIYDFDAPFSTISKKTPKGIFISHERSIFGLLKNHISFCLNLPELSFLGLQIYTLNWYLSWHLIGQKSAGRLSPLTL